MATKNIALPGSDPMPIQNQKRRRAFMAALSLLITGTMLFCSYMKKGLFIHQITKIKGAGLDGKVKISELSETKAPESMTREKQPSQCGLYYFYHVGKCGGTSVRNWMIRLQQANPLNITSDFDFWHYENEDYDWRQQLNDMEDVVYSGKLAVGDKSWLSVHHHHGAPGLRFMMPRLRAWKTTLQSQGCDLILTTVLREPLSRARSIVHYKKNFQRKDFEPFFESGKNNREEGVVNYLLFNKDLKVVPSAYSSEYFKGGPRQDILSTEAIDEVVDYLKEFDIVGQTNELDSFIALSEKATGWSELIHSGFDKGKALKSNKSVQKFNITAEMESFMAHYLQSDLIVWKRVFGEA
jgi:hypothetical protein